MPESDACLHLVDILSAGPAASESIPGDVGRIYFDFDGVIDQRRHEDRSKRSLPFVLGIEGRKPDEPVNSIFTFQISIGIISLEFYGTAFYPGFIPRLHIHDFHLVPILFSPTGIHPQKHVRPIVAFGPAGAGIDAKEGPQPVFLIAEHVPGFESLNGFHGFRKGILHLFRIRFPGFQKFI